MSSGELELVGQSGPSTVGLWVDSTRRLQEHGSLGRCLLDLLNCGEQPFPILESHEGPHFIRFGWRLFAARDEIA